MIDHLRRYDSKDAARADPLAAPYMIDGEPNQSIAFFTRVCVIEGTDTDDEGNTFEVITWLPYVYLWVALPAIDEALAATCVVVGERETRRVVSSMIPPEDWHKYRPEVTMAGSDYLFGAAP